MKNYGVLIGRRPEDYIAGASPIPYEERNPSGDWTPHLPSEERQSSRFADSMACVSYSALNSIETQIKFLTGIERNYSDRALAKMSNTMPQGNYLWRVADTIRQEGLIPDLIWPAPKDFTWDTYYAQIPVEIENTAGEFLKEYDVKYEFLVETVDNIAGGVLKEQLKHHLKHSPIQVVIPGHAVMCFWSGDQIDKYFDTYSPFVKNYNKPFISALKYVVTPKKNKKMTKEEVRALQVLEGYSDEFGVEYWAGKPLSDYLKVRLADKLNQEKIALDKLNQ